MDLLVIYLFIFIYFSGERLRGRGQDTESPCFNSVISLSEQELEARSPESQRFSALLCYLWLNLSVGKQFGIIAMNEFSKPLEERKAVRSCF